MKKLSLSLLFVACAAQADEKPSFVVHDLIDSKCFIAGILILMALLTVMLPLGRFLNHGWKAKRREIVSRLNDESCVEYFRMFCRNQPVPEKQDACAKFVEMYEEWYGRKNFIWPGILLFLTCFFFHNLRDFHRTGKHWVSEESPI